ncbi:putative holin, partial [Klebsiella pneumoniae]
VVYGVITHTDFGVVFGAFGGAVFYVATTANLTRGRQIAYFMTSFIVGVLAAELLGSKFTTWTICIACPGRWMPLPAAADRRLMPSWS